MKEEIKRRNMMEDVYSLAEDVEAVALLLKNYIDKISNATLLNPESAAQVHIFKEDLKDVYASIRTAHKALDSIAKDGMKLACNIDNLISDLNRLSHKPTSDVLKKYDDTFAYMPFNDAIKSASDEAETVDPFYSEENMARLRKAIADLNAGKETAHEVNEQSLDE